MSDTVTVDFAPPAKVTGGTHNQILLQWDGGQAWLPRRHVNLEIEDEVAALELPTWLAQNEGLVERTGQHSSSFKEGEDGVSMGAITRHDWYMGIALLGSMLSGKSGRDAVWEAEKMVRAIAKL